MVCEKSDIFNFPHPKINTQSIATVDSIFPKVISYIYGGHQRLSESVTLGL